MSFFVRFSHSIASRPLLSSSTIAICAGTAFLVSRPRIAMDSAQNAPAKTLNFPGSMLFSKQLKVTTVEQVNHDTKRITFELPGGQSEVSGVTPGGML